ncbi:MAG: spore maturation protein A [Oscillospiraceae bacterium]|nr:spore maturation protein A [Oscillospiraceae bacterium]
MLSWSWIIMVAASLGYALLTGNAASLATGAFDGAAQAVQLCIAMAGILCLWSGVMAVMRASGLAGGLAKLLSPVLGLIFPSARHDNEAMEAISANVSANLLGLGNAATPAGVRAAKRLQKINGDGSLACKDLVALLVMNTASIQLIPATVGGVRASLGAASPFDILLPVWLTSIVAMAFSLAAIKILQAFSSKIDSQCHNVLL